MVTIERTHPTDPQAERLLRESHALMRALFTPEQNNFLSLDDLAAPHVELWILRDGPEALGVGALADMGGYGEIKSFFVDAASRGRGAGAALLSRLEDRAREKGMGDLRLETGHGLDAAMRLYERAGYRYSGPFGAYVENGASLFMRKSLAP